jgi:hypothetical protein
MAKLMGVYDCFDSVDSNIKREHRIRVRYPSVRNVNELYYYYYCVLLLQEQFFRVPPLNKILKRERSSTVVVDYIALTGESHDRKCPGASSLSVNKRRCPMLVHGVCIGRIENAEKLVQKLNFEICPRIS